MNKLLYGIIILSGIGMVVATVFAVVLVRKFVDKEYKGANLISFFFPIVGLLIYAINIGKNDKLAKSCVKIILFGMGYAVVITFLVWLSICCFKDIENTLPAINASWDEIIENDNYTSLDDVRKKLATNGKVDGVDIEKYDRMYSIEIYFSDDITLKEAKNISNNILKEDLNFNYDYQVSFYVDNRPYLGYYAMGESNRKFVWSK